MIAAGPGYLGYGASLLWTGARKPSIYDLRVTPGDATVRRHADQLVSALPTGLQSPNVKLYARFQSSAKWEEIAMSKAAGSFAGGYQFLFAGLPENVEYYVTAGAMASKHFNIKVTDLPSVKQIKVTYHYPTWTGMPAEIEERGGDLRAVSGTEAKLEVSTDRPLPGGQIQARQRPQKDPAEPADKITSITWLRRQDGIRMASTTSPALKRASPFARQRGFFSSRPAKPTRRRLGLLRPGRGDYHASPH